MEPWVFGGAALLALAAVVVTALLARAQGTAARVAAEPRLAEAQRLIAALTDERDAARKAEREAGEALAAARQRIGDAETRLAEFERLKQEFLTATSAAVLRTGQELSSKLLEDHKRESAAAQQQGEEQVRKASEALVKQVEEIAKEVSRLQGRVAEDGERVETVLRALSNPSGAGQFAEIILANTLKSFGLEEGKDFKLQFTTADSETGQRLRPDAVVFLPGNNVLVIDAKASQFLMKAAELEDAEAAEAANQNLARTMNQHLKALAQKDYRNAVVESYRRAGFPGEIGRVFSVMYLPTESMVEALNRSDPGFQQRAADLRIIPAGPAGLACILSFASTEISLGRQIENRERIVETTQALLNSFVTVLGHALGVGRGIKAAAEGFEKLTRSVNGNLLPKARRLAQLGVQPNKPLPGNLPAYQVMSSESALIDGEAEELEMAAPSLAVLAKQAGS